MEYKENIINYQGCMDRNVVDNILHELKSKLKTQELGVLIRKRIYSASVECLDNIYRHSEMKTNTERICEKYPPYFSLKRDGEEFTIESGNLLLNHEVEDLSFKLNRLNKLETEGVNELYKETIMQSAGLSDKGGAGLGLIVIAKTSPRQLFYQFETINKKYSFFTLKVNIL